MAIKGYWRLNGNSNDASGNGYNGTDTNIIYSQANGRLNQGAGFNGSTSKIQLPDAVGINTSFTLSCFVKLNSTSSYCIYSKGSDASGGWGAVLDISTISLTASIVTTSPSPAVYATTPTSISISSGSWHHVAMIFDNSNKICKTYLDSVQIGSINTGSVLRGTNNVFLGVRRPGTSYTNYLNGALDEVIIDPRVWTIAEIKNEIARVKGFF